MPNTSRTLGLSAGRPPLAQRSKKLLPSKVTREIIQRHHQAGKQLAVALKAGDRSKADIIERQIEERGGLRLYQNASIMGQSVERGGDSSRVLVRWLTAYELKGDGRKLKMLEVGALSTTNACSKAGLFEMTWIDLNSQGSEIQQQDFMRRPLPTSDEQRFDAISLSLVVNYVSDPIGRGDMLRRTTDFLRLSEA
jgi:25S rRNA (adenine2142-N1)-methyltransferase